MAKLFKDFDKESKDLLTKYIAEGKAEKGLDKGFGELIWKVESKYKNDKTKCCDVVVNPIFETTGKKECVFNVECALKDFNVSCKKSLKLGATGAPDLWATVPTLTWEQDTHKVEVELAGSIGNLGEVKVTVEEKAKDFAAQILVEHVKLAKKEQKASVEVAAPVPGVDGLQGGLKIEVPYAGGFDFNTLGWTAGARFAPSKCCTAYFFLGGTGKTFGSVSAGASFVVPGFQLENQDVEGAAAVEFAPSNSAYKLTFGATGRTPSCPLKSSWKVKFSNGNKLAESFASYLSLIVPVNGWKVGATVNPINRTFGITAICE